MALKEWTKHNNSSGEHLQVIKWKTVDMMCVKVGTTQGQEVTKIIRIHLLGTTN